MPPFNSESFAAQRAEITRCDGEKFVNLAPLLPTIEMVEECDQILVLDAGHVDFCKCHPDLCTVGVGHCDADEECAAGLRCMGNDFCDATAASAMLLAFEQSVGCEGSEMTQGTAVLSRWDGIEGSAVVDRSRFAQWLGHVRAQTPGQPTCCHHGRFLQCSYSRTNRRWTNRVRSGRASWPHSSGVCDG